MLRGSEDKFCLAYGIFGLAAVAAREHSRVVRRGCGGLRRAYARRSASFPLRSWNFRRTITKAASAARNMLGDEGAWEMAFAQGMAMSDEEAAEYALSEEIVPAPERPPAGGETDDPLTTGSPYRPGT